MTAQLPVSLQQIIGESAAHLGRGLQQIERLESRPDSPCHQINIVLSLIHKLQTASPALRTYATGTVTSRGRVDLIALGEGQAFALLAWNSNYQNREQLANFRPSPREVGGDEAALTEWDDAAERWGVVLRTTYGDEVARDTWIADEPNPDYVRGAGCICTHDPDTKRRESWLFWEAVRITSAE